MISYSSKIQIEKKLKDVKYIYKKICKYKDKIFINNGIDKDTGASPLLVDLSSFLSQSRSIIQYAYKEAKEKYLIKNYDEFVTHSDIISFFKDLRNDEIHEYTVGAHTTIHAVCPLDIKNHEPFKINPNKRKNEAKITTVISKKKVVDDEFLLSLKNNKKYDLIEAAKNGHELYEEQECEGEKDLYILCERYIKELERFIEYGKINGFIT